MKKALKIVSALVAIIVMLLIVLFILLNTRGVQNYLVGKVASTLSKEWGTEVSVGAVSYRIPNHLSVDYLYLSDQQSDTLAFVSSATASFQPKALLNRQLIITSVKIDDPLFKLKKNEDGTTNLQFLIDYFKREKPKNNKFQFQIADVEITNGSLSYRDLGDTIPHDGFSPKDIRIEQLNTKFSIDTLAKDLYAAEIRQFSCAEQSGLVIDDLIVKFLADNHRCNIPKLRLEMGQSQLALTDISFAYDSLKDIAKNIAQLQMSGQVEANNFDLSKFQPLVPRLAGLKSNLNLLTRFQGTPNSLTLDTIALSYGKSLSLYGNVKVFNMLTPDSLDTEGHIRSLNFNMAGVQDLVANLRKEPFVLPKQLFAIGNATYKGDFEGRVENLKLLGELSTDVGALKTNVEMKVTNHYHAIALNGCFSSKQLNLRDLIHPDLGSTAFDVDIALTTAQETPMKLVVDGVVDALTYKGYTHHNITLAGEYQNQNFDGHVKTDDVNGSLEFDGSIRLGEEVHKYQFAARVDNFSPNKLRLIKEYPDFDASIVVYADLEGKHIESLNGYVRLDSLLINNKGSYFLDSLSLRSKTNDATRENHLSISSSQVSGMLYGKYTVASLTNHLLAFLSEYMPLLNCKETKSFNNDLRYFFEVNSTEQLCKVMEIPWYTTKPTTISGFYSDADHRLNAQIDVQHLTNGTQEIGNAVIRAYNSNDQLRLTLSTDMKVPNDTMLVNLDVKMAKDTINANLLWRNLLSDTITAGEFITKASLFKQNDTLCFDANILPTQIFFNNVPFEIGHSTVHYNPNRIEVDSFSLVSRNQHLLLDGIISKAPEDLLTVELENISLDYIFSIVPLKAITLGGEVTGTAKIGALLSQPLIEASVSSQNFNFNGANYGHVEASTDVDLENKRVNFNGDVYGHRESPLATLNGFFGFTNDTIDIIGHANGIKLDFINHFTEGILNNISGQADGDVHIYGIAKKGISVTAKAYVEEGQIGVEYLGTKYHFNDTIELIPTAVLFEGIDVYDDEGHKGALNGRLTHDGHFQDMKYQITLSCEDMMAFDLPSAPDALFYGKGYASGDVSIDGDEKRVNINCSMTTKPGTNVYIPVDGALQAEDDSFITFVDRSAHVDSTQIQAWIENKRTTQTAQIGLNLLVNVTPDANLYLIMDAQSGDIIKAMGEGAIRMELDPQTEDFRMFGNCNILEGTYNFTFQNAMRRSFKVIPGGTLVWTGDPLTPALDINAYYQINASLTDILTSDVLSNVGRSTVPVQCLLNMSGVLTQPDLTFDIKLPNSDEELNSALKSVIHSEEEMRRQIIYLLVLGRFQPINSGAGMAQVFGQNELLSVVSSSLSSQLNNWASQLFENWNFGVNMRTSGEGQDRSMEYEVQILYTPNNRFTLNSNVGYRNDNLSTSTANFIGDFDVEYKIIKFGKLGVKAYTHTNDYREYKTGWSTQGVGLVYRDNFDSAKGLREDWRKAIEDDRRERRANRERRKKKKESRAAAVQATKMTKEKNLDD